MGPFTRLKISYTRYISYAAEKRANLRNNRLQLTLFICKICIHNINHLHMNMATKIEGWGNSHRPGWLDIFRIALGIFITYKGAMFAENIESLRMSMQGTSMAFTNVALAHYVIFAHLLCGP